MSIDPTSVLIGFALYYVLHLALRKRSEARVRAMYRALTKDAIAQVQKEVDRKDHAK